MAVGFGKNPIPLLEVEVSAQNPKFYNGENPEEFERFTAHRRNAKEIFAQGFDCEILIFADGHYDIASYNPAQIRILPAC